VALRGLHERLGVHGAEAAVVKKIITAAALAATLVGCGGTRGDGTPAT
jgi:hypothetical protein